MPIRFTDAEIADLVQESKPLPEDYQSRLRLRPKRGHKESELEVEGALGRQFKVILRQSDLNPLDFSIILAHTPSESNVLFRLKRHNGKSHQHGNRIEGDQFYDFHIHTATERYQQHGMREDAYAETTDRFSDYRTALVSFLEDCNFEAPDGDQLTLFGSFGA